MLLITILKILQNNILGLKHFKTTQNNQKVEI